MPTKRQVKKLAKAEESEPFAFSFGDPESVLQNEWLDYLGVFSNETAGIYEPPYSMSGLAKMRNANAHHGSCLLFRRNMLAIAYRPTSRGLNVLDFRNLALDFLTFGNAYVQTPRNFLGEIRMLSHVPAINMRAKTDGGYRLLQPDGHHVDFEDDEILHITDYDCLQQIYGLPEWLGGMQSALLNQDATLFRRRYYVNGAHMGFIFYSRMAGLSVELQEKLKKQIQAGKGIGNFKSLFLHSPNGQEKAIEIIPVGDISQKDEFRQIKEISADDVLVAHRVPGALAGVRPDNAAGDGDVTKRRLVYLQTETASLATVFEALNDQLPPALHFRFEIPKDLPEDAQ